MGSISVYYNNTVNRSFLNIYINRIDSITSSMCKIYSVKVVLGYCCLYTLTS